MNKTEQLVAHDLMVLTRRLARSGETREPMDMAKSIALDHGLSVDEVYPVVLDIIRESEFSKVTREQTNRN